MAQATYDITSPKSLLEFARGLSGKSLADVVDMAQVIENISNKGDLGNMVEKYYYKYQPDNTSHRPDFPEAGVELKTTGVLRRSAGGYKAKERLVLAMINYMTLVEEKWDTSSLMEKCSLMLILFYFYEENRAVYDRKFVLNPILFEFPDEDLEIIKRDWEAIKGKVEEGKAHELSEGDTYYLGACRKGSGGKNEKLKQQPFSDILAKSRAFSLKPTYVNRIIEGHTSEVALKVTDEITIEDATQNKFQPYIGRTVEEISDMLDFHKNGKNDKGFYRNLTMRMLGGVKKTIPELEKAGIVLKTIRVNNKWKPEEDMSFPVFKYLDIINEDWEDSVFSYKIEQRFLFVIFRLDNEGKLRLEKVNYWNMPYVDREEAHRVWEDTKRRVLINAKDLPKSSESRVAHVRPKGRNKKDTILTPQGTMEVKKCFWLNKKYLEEVLKNIG